MLWIEKYRPDSYETLLGQEAVVRQLRACTKSENIPHLMVIGKPGIGKSAALEIFTKNFYAEATDENTTILPVSTMFSQGHAYFEGNDRFSHLYEKNKSVLANFKYIVKWHASMKPLSAPFRIIIFDGAGDLPKDAQAALRRIMEQYSKTCRFVFVTNSLSSLIEPIRSRCVPLFFLPIDTDTIQSHLRAILKEEGVENKISEDMIDMIALGAKGDLRKAIIWTELATNYGITDPLDLSKTETSCLSDVAIHNMVDGNTKKAQQIAENLMIEYGLTATNVLSLLRKSIRAYQTPETAILFAHADASIREGMNEYLQMNSFIFELTKLIEHK